MFDRLKRLFGATANKALDQLETPEILAEKALNELESNLKKLTDGVASSMANEKMLDKKLKANAEQLESWQKRAGIAVQNNNDEIARECLVKKNELIQLDADLKEQLRVQQSTTTELKQRYRETETALKQLRSQKDNIGARSQAADALAKANQILSTTGAGGGMSQWEEKINMKEARAQAAGEMAQESKLQDQFQQSSIEDELAALKQSTEPKLIEDKESES